MILIQQPGILERDCADRNSLEELERDNWKYTLWFINVSTCEKVRSRNGRQERSFFSRETAQQTRGDRGKEKNWRREKSRMYWERREEVVDGEKDEVARAAAEPRRSRGLLAGRLAVKIEICTDSSMRGGERLKRARKCLGPED